MTYLWLFSPVHSFLLDILLTIVGALCVIFMLQEFKYRISNLGVNKLFKGLNLFLDQKIAIPDITLNFTEVENEIHISFYQDYNKLIFQTSFDHTPYTVEQIHDFAIKLDEIMSSQLHTVEDYDKSNLSKIDVLRSVMENKLKHNITEDNYVEEYFEATPFCNYCYSSSCHHNKNQATLLQHNPNNKKLNKADSIHTGVMVTIGVASFLIFFFGCLLKINHTTSNTYKGYPEVHGFIKHHKFEKVPTIATIENIIKQQQSAQDNTDNQKVEVEVLCKKNNNQTFLTKYVIDNTTDKYYSYTFSPSADLVSSLDFDGGDNKKKMIDKLCKISE